MKLKFLFTLSIVLLTSFSQAETLKHFGINGAYLEPQPAVQKEGSYMINGVGYTTRTNDDTIDYSREGTASYYHNDLEGSPTANGEIYHPTKFTAAHKTLPLGSYAVVTNLRNNRKVIVKINDRGPFVKTRLIDLSKRAAQEIGMLNSGVARVRVEALQVDKNGKITGAGVPTLVKNARTKEGLQRLDTKVASSEVKKENISSGFRMRIMNIKTQKQADELIKKLNSVKKLKSSVIKKGNSFEVHLENIANKAEVYRLKNALSKLDKRQNLTVYTYN